MDFELIVATKSLAWTGSWVAADNNNSSNS